MSHRYLLLVGLALGSLVDAVSNPGRERSISVLDEINFGFESSASQIVYQTPVSYSSSSTKIDSSIWGEPEYSSGPSELPTTPGEKYSTSEDVIVQTTTLVRSHSITITSIIFETYYSTLTNTAGQPDEGTTTDSPSSAPSSCAYSPRNPSEYGDGCSPLWTPSSSSESPSTEAQTAAPVTTAYPTPSESDQGRSSGVTATEESPPVVTGGTTPLRAADVGLVGAIAGFLVALA